MPRRYRRAKIIPRRYYKGAKGIWGKVKNIGGMAMKALSMLNSEEKHKDTVYSVTAQTTTPVLTLVNGLAQGTTNVTRVGDDVRWKSVYIRGAWAHNGGGNAVQFGRIILFRDNQPNGAAPAASAILEDASDPFSPLNLDYSRRFKVLYDKNICLTDSGREGEVIKKYIDLTASGVKTHSSAGGNIHKTDYGLGNAGTVADISTGSYYILTMADAAAGMSVRYTCRMRYVDN